MKASDFRTEKICSIAIGSHSETHIINDFLKEGQKHIPFDDLDRYMRYEKTKNFLKRRFRKLGYVPSFFVKNDTFYAIKVIQFVHRGRLCESVSCIPIVSARGKFKRFELDC